MTIERDEQIRFHEQGTLEAVTRWIATHHDGLSEWFKNVRRQYQVDRANVAPEHRVALLLLQDARGRVPARIGVLDVGGASLEDVTAWSVWQDPDASKRGSKLAEEETQGNGGKAYMYRLFTGATRIFGVRDGRRNCKGFDGPTGTVERGKPGWVPSQAAGRDVEISSFEAELKDALSPYDVLFEELPADVQTALKTRKSFTLVEGQSPIDLYKGRIDADDLISKVVRHEQSLLCLEQVAFYVFHNGKIINDGARLKLPSITPYPGIESPIVFEIPETLPNDSDQDVSTTENGKRPRGRVILHTSAENMPAAYRNLRPRWQVVYRTQHQMIGAKPVAELAGATPGCQYIYATVELPALEPAYVEHGRRRPKPGPLTEAVDRFVTQQIRTLAHKISATRQEHLDERALDEVHEENRRLDEFKNRFLPSFEDVGGGGGSGRGPGGGGPSGAGGARMWGTVPEEISCSHLPTVLEIGKGVNVSLRAMLSPVVRDANGRAVRSKIEWFTNDRHVGHMTQEGVLEARGKGACEVWAQVRGTTISTPHISIRVRVVDHVLLTPRSVEVPVGKNQQIVAEVTDDEGGRSTNVLLDWRHDAADQLLVRIDHVGNLVGNRVGRTAVTAGAGEVWARIPSEVEVVPNPNKMQRGAGFPRLLVTGRDVDPSTGSIREGDPDQPALWQEPSDYRHNVWWLNVQCPDAAFAFHERSDSPTLWRTYHAGKVIEMVVQVWMMEEFTRKGESQRPDFWGAHLAAMDRHRVRITQQMWRHLEPYISSSFPTGNDPLAGGD